MRSILTVIAIIISICSFGQKNHLSIGNSTNGICFGNSSQFNGIRFNIIDDSCLVYNGLNLSLLSSSQSTNGINFGLLSSTHDLANGINIGGLISKGSFNGISITGFWSMTSKVNGISISGLNTGDTLNGLTLGYWTVYAHKELNGVALSTFFVHADKLSGLSITLLKNEFTVQNGISFSIFNDAKELHGIQIGLLNHAENNRRLFRWVPFFNFNFRKKTATNTN